MKPIELDLMLQYRYLSNLNSYNGNLLFVDTLADTENNDYTQRLHCLNPETKEDQILVEDKRIRYALVDGKLLLLKGSESEFVETNVYDLNGKLFTLPLGINTIESLNDEYYYVEANSTVDCPDYYKSTSEQKQAYHDFLTKEKDYLVLNEYPFFFNAVGFINGCRNNAYLVNKKDLTVTRITPYTMDVEMKVIHDGKLYLMANDYQSMKKMWSSVYELDLETLTLKCLYLNENVYISKIFWANGGLHVAASTKTCISGKSFYTIEDGKLNCVFESEYMFGNSIGSDCKYGKTRNNMTVGEDFYVLNTVDEKSVLNKYDGKNLTFLTDFEGSCDDFTFVNDDLYIIALKDMKLQEVYKVEAGNYVQLTEMNTEVLADKYVAKPECLATFNVHEIRGFALKPFDFDPDKKYPMILDIHGGPKTAYGQVFYHEMQLWASKGYFVVFCNPHCSDGRGDDFSDYLTHYGATDYDDIMKFVDKVLETYPQIDPERLGVTGGSYGGYMTNWIVTHTNRFKAAASQRSISNRVADFYYSDYSYDTTYENGIPLDSKAIELFWDRSPLKYVDNCVTPTLFIQSTEDYRCPFPEALQLFSALKWKGVETRICGFKGENHELSRAGKPAHRLRRLSEITQWMESHVK